MEVNKNHMPVKKKEKENYLKIKFQVPDSDTLYNKM